MTAPPDLGDGFAALLPSGSADHERLAEGLILALPEPALLVTRKGAILVANGAAAALFEASPATLRGRRLTEFVSDEPEAVARYFGACARSRSPLPGVLHPLARRNPGLLSDQMGRGDERAAIGSAASADATVATTAAGPSRHGVSGAVIRPAAPRVPALILLRFRAREEASNRFALLNRQLEESMREIRARRRADAALQAANARLEEQTRALESMNRRLRDQAAELERQIGAARDLAKELVAANDALRDANEELREQSRAAEAARRDAESANRAKSDFLAVMSHELRTPLNAIGGYVELIELGIRGPVTEAQRADLERIQRAQRHLLARISEVLSFARLEAGQVHYDYGDVIVDALLRDIESLVAPQMKAQRLRYVYEGVTEAIVARADREKLEQILLNLLSNAVKFTPSGGTITVSCAAEECWVRIRVRDTGVGIAPDKIERVFEPFVQLDQRLSRSRDGVGLGLAISRDLARAMGGELSVASTPGAGSTFTLALPAVG